MLLTVLTDFEMPMIGEQKGVNLNTNIQGHKNKLDADGLR